MVSLVDESIEEGGVTEIPWVSFPVITFVLTAG